MARSVAIIGAGQIGAAAAGTFSIRDWRPKIYAGTRPDWFSDEFYDFEPYVLGEGPAPKADAVVDTIAFDAEDIERYDPEAIGRLIVISSASVYCDEEGRTLDEGPANGYPVFDGPIREEQPTVSPGPQTYSTRKVRMERRAQELFGDRATILRPCAIFGEHSRHPREWWFVKRMLDGREVIPIAYGGESRFQTTDVGDIGAFAEHAVDYDWGGVFNIATADAPSVLEIGERIAHLLGKDVRFRTFDGPPVDHVGRTPWSVPQPFTVSNLKSREVADNAGYALGIGREFEKSWYKAPIRALAKLNPSDWRAAFPQLAAYPWDMFDYEAEDRFLASL
ncbi:MAG: reductase [Pseudomonadota bacterium]